MDKLLKKANVSIAVGTSSWREQFIDAITVSAGIYRFYILLFRIKILAPEEESSRLYVKNTCLCFFINGSDRNFQVMKYLFDRKMDDQHYRKIFCI